MSAFEIAKNAAAGALEKKASRVVVQDLKGSSDLAEFQVICSADNDRQTKAIAQGIEERCQQLFGTKPIAIEGKQSGHWILLDYGNVLIHIFFSPIRDYYAIESLWPNAKTIDIKPN